MNVDLIIPAFNEAGNIDPLFDVLDDLQRARSISLRRIIVADNGSTDGTAARAAARGAVVVAETRRGYGAACLAAIQWIRDGEVPVPDVIVFLDADVADDPAEMPRLLDSIASGRADLVIGSRVRRAEPGSLNIAQRLGNGLACRLIRMLTGKRFTDLGPFRAIRWSALERLAMEDRTWGWTVEMQMKAALLEIRAEEVDVGYRRRHSGRSKVSGTVRGVVTAGSKIIFTILSLWLRRRALRVAQYSERKPQMNTDGL